MSLEPRQNVVLAPYTTLHVGGVADYMTEVTTEDELKTALLYAREHTAMSPLVLGGGSNVLISDDGYCGVVIRMKMKGIALLADSSDAVVVRVAAGEDWDNFVEYTVAEGWGGLENLSGIPGTVGAAPVQNINAYGASVADVIECVAVYDVNKGESYTLSRDACQFGYRDSVFKRAAGASMIVTAVTFRLAPAARTNLTYQSSSQSIARYLAERHITEPTLSDTREAVLFVRRNIGMLAGQFRSAGSFFKNTIVSQAQFTHLAAVVQAEYATLGEQLSPWYWMLPDGNVKISTAFLMECSPYNKRTYSTAQWNGVVGISPKHSLSIVTYEGATAHDVITFAEEIISTIKNIFAVTIESEVVMIEKRKKYL